MPETTSSFKLGAVLLIVFKQLFRQAFPRMNGWQKQFVFLIITLHYTKNLVGIKACEKREMERRQTQKGEKKKFSICVGGMKEIT